MNDTIDIVKALLELDFICIDVDKRDTYIYKMLNDLVIFIENVKQLERDVKRFIELLMKDNHTGRDTFDIEILKNKLKEVGNEE